MPLAEKGVPGKGCSPCPCPSAQKPGVRSAPNCITVNRTAFYRE
jgi:hypothetical protein